MIKKQFILPSVETNNFYEKDLKTYYNLSIQSPISIKAQLYIVEIVLNKIYSIFKSTKENNKEFIIGELSLCSEMKAQIIETLQFPVDIKDNIIFIADDRVSISLYIPIFTFDIVTKYTKTKYTRDRNWYWWHKDDLISRINALQWIHFILLNCLKYEEKNKS